MDAVKGFRTRKIVTPRSYEKTVVRVFDPGCRVSKCVTLYPAAGYFTRTGCKAAAEHLASTLQETFPEIIYTVVPLGASRFNLIPNAAHA